MTREKLDQYDEPERTVCDSEPTVKLRVGDQEPEPESAQLGVARLADDKKTKSDPGKTKLPPTATRKRVDSFLRFVFIPAGLWLFQYIMTPGFITPYLNHPVARTVGLSLFTWLMIGGAVYCQSKGFFRKLLCVLVFMMPVLTVHIWFPILFCFVSPDVIRALFNLGGPLPLLFQ